MKPASFDYHRPAGLGEALNLLAEAGQHGKVLAGGQSLVPMLNMRLAAPRKLIDVNTVRELAYVRVVDGDVEVGALARHADLARDPAAYAAIPLLRRATEHVAHPTIRNRGTTVGSLVHADPAAELPAVLTLLDGHVTLAAAGGRRTVPARDFFVGPLESCVRPGELAVSATFRAPPPGTGSAWLELSRRHGDYALCGVGVLVTLDPDQRIVAARAALISVGPVPVLVDLADAVVGRPADVADWAAAAAVVAAAIDPEDDIHATAAYRRHLAGVLTARALRAAAQEASTHVRP
ncbi:FAD binding domain-containing protein [Micromonospora sp. MS34]|uniref:FAD binding domain-containing protein n=1 Tax=Micromonospora sp. MS34 TaxID=3385971 RepID=UPI0039A397C5